MTRRLIIGVYSCHSFFNASPSDGYPNCGFDEYLMNEKILGHDFLMEWVKLTYQNQIVSCGIRAKVTIDDDLGTRLWIKKSIDVLQNGVSGGLSGNTFALQVIGRHLNKPGFFLSHWYTQYGFDQLLRSVFSSDQFTINTVTFAKGMVFIVDPIKSKPKGIVTVLNNVIGNVLPDDQYQTLSAIREIIL